MARDGFLNLITPPGMTSHDLVAWVRARLAIRRVGHLGTLDPAAAGVLPICVGRATRLFRFAAGPQKAYRAEIVFGAATDTLDADGRVVSQSNSSDLTEPRLRELLQRFTGDIDQRPPAFSAAHLEGRRLHERARRGEAAAGRPKRVTVASLDLVEFSPGTRARALVDVLCTTGTYVRGLASDLGAAAGCGAYLGFLVRTRAGRFELSDALTPEEFAAALGNGDEEAIFISLDWPLAHLPSLSLASHAARDFVRGTRVCAGDSPAWPVRVYGPDRHFLGLGCVLAKGQLHPRVVLTSEGGSSP